MSSGTVGFIGLGIMGDGMARCLLKSGRSLVVWNRSAAKCDALKAEAGDAVTVLASPAWAKAYGLLEAYGAFGMFLISCLPIFLHPVIVFGVISGMSNVGILAIILVGRTVKYLVMAWVTANAPSALRFFGVKADLLAFAEKAIDDEKYGDPVPDPIDPNKPQLRLRTSSFI